MFINLLTELANIIHGKLQRSEMHMVYFKHHWYQYVLKNALLYFIPRIMEL